MSRATLTLTQQRSREWREWAENHIRDSLSDGGVEALREADDFNRELDGRPTFDEEYS